MEIIDLSQPLHAGMPVYPGTAQPQFTVVATVEADGYRMEQACFNYHVGTHLDAPAHMLPGGATLDAYEAARFVGRAAVLDVAGPVGLETLAPQAARLSRLDYLLLRTGWSSRWGAPAYFQGYPVLSAEAARWLGGFSLRGVGIDAPSFDPVDSEHFPIHRLLLGQGLLLLENLAHLERLGEGEFTFACLPLPLRGADGSPVRAVAMLP